MSYSRASSPTLGPSTTPFSLYRPLFSHLNRRHACVLCTWLTLGIAGCDRGPFEADKVQFEFGGMGLGDGKLSYPRAIAAETDGSVFIVDKSGRVQRFSGMGQFELGWRMPESQSGKPVGITVHPDGRLFIADTHYHRVMVFDRNGQFLTSFGHAGFGDGEFSLPTDVAVDAQGFIYVSEYYENDRITKWTPELRFANVLSPPLIAGKPLNRPTGLVIDAEQTLWVADSCHHRLIRLTLDGEILAVFGSLGRQPGEMRYPYDISISPEQTLMVCEYGGDRLQWFSQDGRSLKTWGRSGRKAGELSGPWGAAYGSAGRVYVVDSINNRVQVLEP